MKKRWAVRSLGAQYGAKRVVVPNSEKHFVLRFNAQRYANRMNGFTPIIVPLGDGVKGPLNVWEVVKRAGRD